MKKKLISIFIISFFVPTLFAQKIDWLVRVRRIIPLVTNEKDVEKKLGKPIDRYADTGEYETSDGLFTVTYSEGKCSENPVSKYDVPKGVVLQFDFSPKRKILFSSLNIDVSKLPTEVTNDVFPPTVSYIDTRNGIDYVVHGAYLKLVEIYPADNHSSLECRSEKDSDQ